MQNFHHRQYNYQHCRLITTININITIDKQNSMWSSLLTTTLITTVILLIDPSNIKARPPSFPFLNIWSKYTLNPKHKKKVPVIRVCWWVLTALNDDDDDDDDDDNDNSEYIIIIILNNMIKIIAIAAIVINILIVTSVIKKIDIIAATSSMLS